MRIVAPDYYKYFKCIADNCRHSCCIGWEIDVDEDTLPLFLKDTSISKHIELLPAAHIVLDKEEKCPFLNINGLCEIILKHGEGFLCQICRDHPRFRNYWSDREELGLGMVCEEAARIILSQNHPMQLITLFDDGRKEKLTPDELSLMDLRSAWLQDINVTGPYARLKEYLIYRHLPDAMYDGLLYERIQFIENAFNEIISEHNKTDGSMSALIECVRVWSYNVEYDDEVIPARLEMLHGSK